MPAQSSSFDSLVDDLLEAPLFYQMAKTFLQLNPFPACQFASLLSLASLSSLHGNDEQALREVNRALKLEPRNADAYHLQAVILIELERIEEALTSLETLVALKPDSVEGWTLLGTHQYNTGRRVRSIYSFEQALKISPNYLDALTGLCAGLHAAKRYKEVLPIVTRALARPEATDTIKSHLHCHLGMAYIQLKEFERGHSNLSLALKFDPQNLMAWSGRAQAAVILGKDEEALSAAQHVLARQPDHHEALTYAATALSMLKREEEAVVLYDKMIALNEKDAGLWADRGAAFAQLKRWPEAIADCQRCIELDETNVIGWVNRGYVYEKLEQPDEAVNCYQRALQIDPEYLLAWNNLSSAYSTLFLRAVKQNDWALAEQHWHSTVYAGHQSKFKSWLDEEFNCLKEAAQTGNVHFVHQLCLANADNHQVVALRHALEFLITREVTHLADLPAHQRAEVEKLINQF